MIDCNNFAGWIDLYANGFTNGFSLRTTEDEYGLRSYPIVRDDVLEWLKDNLDGRYVLSSRENEEWDDEDAFCWEADDRILFRDDRGMILFKLRWL